MAGMPSADIPAFLTTRLQTATMIDAATAVVALHLLSRGAPLQPVTQAWAARTPSHVMRAASVELGRGYERLLQRLLQSVNDFPPGTARVVGRRPSPDRPTARRGEPRPIAMARVAGELGVTATDLARVICYDDVQSICAAALKLTPLDPLDPVTWALALAPLIEETVTQVAGLTTPDDIPAPTAPAAELWQHHHATAPRRLFRA